MFTAGITAEFDPFHKGHEYLIQQARERGATHIAVVMSGAAVQRGETASFSKHERADIAMRCGADLVAELPAPYSCSAARYFADAAVQILGQLSPDVICFGSETESAESIVSAARAAESLTDSPHLKKLLENGMSYPAALRAAVCGLYGTETAAPLDTPNSTLGIEYTAALERHGITAGILPVKRVGAGHDERSGDSAFPSGSALREALRSGEGIADGVPEGCVPEVWYDPSLAGDILLYRLLTAEKEELLALPEVNLPIADRIMKVRRDPPGSLGEFLAAVKTANVTHARLRRSALHLVLGVTGADFLPPPYVRVLAFNGRGAEILRRAKGDIPVSQSLRALEQSSPAAARIAALENRAVRLQQMCRVSVSGAGTRFENEYTRKITVRK